MCEGLPLVDSCGTTVLGFLRELPVQEFRLTKEYHRNSPFSQNAGTCISGQDQEVTKCREEQISISRICDDSEWNLGCAEIVSTSRNCLPSIDK